MKRLRCPVCANEVFFDSLQCVRCLTELVIALEPGGQMSVVDAATTRACVNRTTWACNWTADAGGDTPTRCASCALVDPGGLAEDPRMVPFQTAQRRVLLQLSVLGVGWDRESGLRLAYRSNSAGHDAVIGHRAGEITLDLDEADPARQEAVRTMLGELYRTPLGHLRHELGHFVWFRTVGPWPDRLAEFRAVFGDETVDYDAALARHYARGDDGAWRDDFVSFYASAHPWEDFAESWAQLMHVHDVVETGAEWGVVEAPPDRHEPDPWLTASVTASVAANELARAMGMRDLYPFTLTPSVRTKIEFCWRLIP